MRYIRVTTRCLPFKIKEPQRMTMLIQQITNKVGVAHAHKEDVLYDF